MEKSYYSIHLSNGIHYEVGRQPHHMIHPEAPTVVRITAKQRDGAGVLWFLVDLEPEAEIEVNSQYVIEARRETAELVEA